MQGKVVYNVGDIVEMKKAHPCGCKEFILLRVGLDFKLKCNGCGHEIMVPRLKIQKSIKRILKSEEANNDR